MSTDLTTTSPTTEGTVEFHRPDLNEWARNLQAAHTIGSALCTTSFAPVHFRGKPDEAAAAILYGSEVGFTPTQALQNLYVIGGKPALYARPMVAIVQARGHRVWTESKTDESVTVCGQRKGSEHVERETWDIARAKLAGYTNNKKYQTDPQAMLYARAASDVCRRVAADALAGMAYSVEELQLDQVEATAARPRGLDAVRAAAAPAAEPEPEVVEATVEPEPTDTPALTYDEPRPLTKRTRGHVFALLSDLWPKEDGEAPDERAVKERKLIGWALGMEGPIASRADLDEDMGQAVVDKFNAEKTRREVAAAQAGA